MVWKQCTAKEAQAAANSGIAAISISNDCIAMLPAVTEETTVSATDEAIATAAVMTLGTVTTTADVEYYSYGKGVVTLDQFRKVWAKY